MGWVVHGYKQEWGLELVVSLSGGPWERDWRARPSRKPAEGPGEQLEQSATQCWRTPRDRRPLLAPTEKVPTSRHVSLAPSTGEQRTHRAGDA